MQQSEPCRKATTLAKPCLTHSVHAQTELINRVLVSQVVQPADDAPAADAPLADAWEPPKEPPALPTLPAVRAAFLL